MKRSRSSAARWPAYSFVTVCSLLLVSCSGDLEQSPTSSSPEELAVPTPASGLAPQDFGPAMRAVERHTPALMRRDGVLGTAVGLDRSGSPVAKVFLLREGAPALPSRLDGVRVVPEVTGMFVVREEPTDRARPASLGASIGHPDVTAGTLGARVRDASGTIFILSNNHVLANGNGATLGDATLQPGALDGGSEPEDVIGTLADFEPIEFGGAANTMDAAITVVDGADLRGATPDGVAYGAPGTDVTSPTLGMGVQKYGRTTGHTLGSVAELNVTVSVCYEPRGPFRCALSATFTDQFTITDGSFSAGGDSGSLIVTNGDGNNPVGLLFAGSSTRTIANPIGPVLERFEVAIDPTVPDETDPPPTEGTVSGTVTDASTGAGIAGAAVQVEGTTLTGTTDSDGGYSIDGVPEGSQQVTATADGYVSRTESVQVTAGETTTLDFALEPDADDPTDPDDPDTGTFHVTDVQYGGTGGRLNDRHLLVFVAVADGDGAPVGGASVSAVLESGGSSWDFSGATEADGTVGFRLTNAPSGCYQTTVTSLSAGDLEWDGSTPSNEHCR